MRRSMAIAAAAATLLAASPAAAQWRVAAAGGNSPVRVVFLVDTDSVSRDGEAVRFRTQTIMETPGDMQDWDRSVTLREGRCDEASSAIRQNSFYRDGVALETDATPREPVRHAPDSLMYGVLQAVCGADDYMTEASDDPEPLIRAYFRNSR